MEPKALQWLEDFNLIAAFITHTYKIVTKSMVLSNFILEAVQDKTAFTQEPSKKLINLIYEVQQRDTFYATFYTKID